MRFSFIRYCLTPALTFSLMGLAGSIYADPASDVLDARQETQIWTTFALSPYLRANDLRVSVHDGKASLTGKVDEDVNKDLAKQIALGVKGIKEVDNQILVEADYHPAAESNNYGQTIDDASVSAAIKSKLAWSKYTDGRSIAVDTKNGRVTLRGNAATKQSRDYAGRLAMATRGVVSVNNQVMLEPAKPASQVKGSVSEMEQDLSDTWISTKVRSNFLYASNVSASDIEVTTNKKEVTLKGKVDSGAERALAIELAQNVRGVKSVNAKDLTF